MKSAKIVLIEGGIHEDERGILAFANAFDMTQVRRFYQIKHTNTQVIRAWQGHKIERKWFYCSEGSFLVNVVEIDDWVHPSPSLQVHTFTLAASRPQVLSVEGGCVTGLQALEHNAALMVFSDMDTNQSKADDFRFDKDLWYKW